MIVFFLKIIYNIKRLVLYMLVEGFCPLEVNAMIGSKIGMWEIILIVAVALIIFGPAKLPELGRSIGNGLKEFRRATRELKDSVSLDESDIDLNDKKS
jgi:sec-independent protein translocase protein TatA